MPDVLVLGAGPAGLAAARAAASYGADTLVLDAGSIARTGKARLAAGRQVWSVSASLRVDAIGPAGLDSWQPRALIVATGAHERVVPFPGWTLPGVVGLTATALADGRTVVAGCGPLLAAVAWGILQVGGAVAAVIDLAASADWAGAIRAAGVPVLFRHGVRAARGGAAGLQIEAAPVDVHGGWVAGGMIQHFSADRLAVGHGMTPATEVTRLLRARHIFARKNGGWVAACDDGGRTSLPRLYVAGDCAGVFGARRAGLHGRLAGLAAAGDLGLVEPAVVARRGAVLRRGLSDDDDAATLMALRPAQVQGISPDTVVCRCEDVTRADIEAAVADGATEMNQLKAFTRCGMGPCQGRMCEDVAAELAAAKVGGREVVGRFTGRAPLRPISLSALTGHFDYADIPIPASAPL